MDGGVEGEDVEGAGAKGLVGGGIGEEVESDNRFSQYVEIAPDEVGVEFLLRVEEAENLLLVEIDMVYNRISKTTGSCDRIRTILH